MTSDSNQLDWHRVADLDELLEGRVKTADRLRAVLDESLAHKGPSLVEIITDPDLI
jgi:thiamine pyrophosphate-dependent acetolactate synthase large subunit-like protein